MIYTVTFNPAIDYIMHTDEIRFGKTNRSQSEAIQFGGKGINVSTVLARLGAPTVALGFVAGFTGQALEQAVQKNGVKTDFIHLPSGCTRINVKLKGDQETEINAGGPEIPAEAVRTLQEKLEMLTAADTLVLAGSVPSSLPRNMYETILASLQGKGIRFVVDASGDLLRSVLAYRPFLVKPNRQELVELVGQDLPNLEAVTMAAEQLQKQGAENVLVSLGGEGALLLDADGKRHFCPPCTGTPVNTVGAGDSMLAGFLVGVKRDYAYALKLGSAAGGATAFADGLATKEAIDALMEISQVAWQVGVLPR